MRKKINLTALTVTALAAALFTSCSKSSDSNTSLIGKWEGNSIHALYTDTTTTPNTTSTYDSTYTHGHSYIIELRADNTYTETDYTVTNPYVDDSGTYVLANGTITLIGIRNNINLLPTANYSISGSVMTLTGTTHSGRLRIDVTEKLTKQ